MEIFLPAIGSAIGLMIMASRVLKLRGLLEHKGKVDIFVSGTLLFFMGGGATYGTCRSPGRYAGS